MALKFFQSRLGKTIKWLGMVLVALLLLAILLIDVFKVGSVALPPAVDVELVDGLLQRISTAPCRRGT